MLKLVLALAAVSFTPSPLLKQLEARAAQLGYALAPIQTDRVPLPGSPRLALSEEVWRFGDACATRTLAPGGGPPDWSLVLPDARVAALAMPYVEDNTVPCFAGFNPARTSLCVITMEGSGHFEQMAVYSAHGERWVEDRSGPIMERATPTWPLDRWPFKDVPDDQF